MDKENVKSVIEWSTSNSIIEVSQSERAHALTPTDAYKGTAGQRERRQSPASEATMGRNADINQRIIDSEKPRARRMASPTLNSPRVRRGSVAVLPMAPFSPGRDIGRLDFTARLRSGAAKAHSVPMISIIRRDEDAAGFESPEPTSPKVSCIGQIKLKQKWVKNSKQCGEKAECPKFGKLKKLFYDANKEDEDPRSHGAGCPTEEAPGVSCPSPGHLKRYTSGSYEAKFGKLFVGGDPVVRRSGSILLDALPKPETKGCPSEINIWRRRAVAAPKALEVKGAGVDKGFEGAKPYTM